MIGWAIEALLASALLMAVVLVIRTPVRRYFGPGIAYALWALPAFRLLLPPLPQFHSAAPQLLSRASETVTIYVIEPLGGSTAAPVSLYSSLGTVLAVLWGAGAAAFLPFARARRVGPCAIAEHELSKPPSGSVSTCPTRNVVGLATSCFFS